MNVSANASEASVSIRGVAVEYPGRSHREPVTAVEGVSLDVAANEFVCIVGPSGCGKSTLLKAVGGLVVCSRGTIGFRGVQNWPLRTAMVWQEDALIPWRTLLANVCLPLELRRVGRKERTDRSMSYLGKMGIEEFANAYPREVSGGMRQRAGIARAFVADAEVLLMDEPFGALDAQTRLLLQEELLNLWQREQKTVIFVTHSIQEAVLLGDRITVMSARPGRILETIINPFGHPRTREIERLPEFHELNSHIWNLLRSDVQRADRAG